jgi:hypothetical protein
VRVEGTLDGPIYIGGPNHLLCLTQLKYKTIYRLRKPRKPDYSDPGAWRPIALLSTLGKVVETLVARQLSDLAEQERLLPDVQMGNRRNRSIETALELLVEQIHTIWKTGNQVASILSLDIARAFDIVNHLRLLDNL